MWCPWGLTYNIKYSLKRQIWTWHPPQVYLWSSFCIWSVTLTKHSLYWMHCKLNTVWGWGIFSIYRALYNLWIYSCIYDYIVPGVCQTEWRLGLIHLLNLHLTFVYICTVIHVPIVFCIGWVHWLMGSLSGYRLQHILLTPIHLMFN